jgi:hypothetical protein
MKAEFLTPLRTEKIGAQRWLLTDDLHFRSARYAGVFVVSRGFQTDLASIPRVFWVVAPKVDLYDQAAVVHDAGYGNALLTEDGRRVFAAKAVCDRLFHEGMLAMKVPTWRAALMFKVVDALGKPDGHPLRNALPPIDVRMMAV